MLKVLFIGIIFHSFVASSRLPINNLFNKNVNINQNSNYNQNSNDLAVHYPCALRQKLQTQQRNEYIDMLLKNLCQGSAIEKQLMKTLYEYMRLKSSVPTICEQSAALATMLTTPIKCAMTQKSEENTPKQEHEILEPKTEFLIAQQETEKPTSDVIIEKIEVMPTKPDIIIEKQEKILTPEPETTTENQDIVTQKSEIIIKKQKISAPGFDKIIEKEEILTSEPETTIENQEKVTQKPGIIIKEKEILTPGSETIIISREIVTQKPEIVTQKPEIVTQKPDIIIKKEEILTPGSETIIISREIVTQKPEIVTQKPERVTQKPGIIIKKEEILTPGSEIIIEEQKKTLTPGSETIIKNNEIVTPKLKIIIAEQEIIPLASETNQVPAQNQIQDAVKQMAEKHQIFGNDCFNRCYETMGLLNSENAKSATIFEQSSDDIVHPELQITNDYIPIVDLDINENVVTTSNYDINSISEREEQQISKLKTPKGAVLNFEIPKAELITTSESNLEDSNVNFNLNINSNVDNSYDELKPFFEIGKGIDFEFPSKIVNSYYETSSENVIPTNTKIDAVKTLKSNIIPSITDENSKSHEQKILEDPTLPTITKGDFGISVDTKMIPQFGITNFPTNDEIVKYFKQKNSGNSVIPSLPKIGLSVGDYNSPYVKKIKEAVEYDIKRPSSKIPSAGADYLSDEGNDLLSLGNLNNKLNLLIEQYMQKAPREEIINSYYKTSSENVIPTVETLKKSNIIPTINDENSKSHIQKIVPTNTKGDFGISADTKMMPQYGITNFPTNDEIAKYFKQKSSDIPSVPKFGLSIGDYNSAHDKEIRKAIEYDNKKASSKIPSLGEGYLSDGRNGLLSLGGLNNGLNLEYFMQKVPREEIDLENFWQNPARYLTNPGNLEYYMQRIPKGAISPSADIESLFKGYRGGLTYKQNPEFYLQRESDETFSTSNNLGTFVTRPTEDLVKEPNFNLKVQRVPGGTNSPSNGLKSFGRGQTINLAKDENPEFYVQKIFGGGVAPSFDLGTFVKGSKGREQTITLAKDENPEFYIQKMFGGAAAPSLDLGTFVKGSTEHSNQNSNGKYYLPNMSPDGAGSNGYAMKLAPGNSGSGITGGISKGPYVEFRRPPIESSNNEFKESSKNDVTP